jgi:hypothetical protein
MRGCTIPRYDDVAPGVGLVGAGAWVVAYQLIARRVARELSDVVLARHP